MPNQPGDMSGLGRKQALVEARQRQKKYGGCPRQHSHLGAREMEKSPPRSQQSSSQRAGEKGKSVVCA